NRKLRVNEFDASGRLWNRATREPQSLKMEWYRFADQFFDFFVSIRGCDAAREVRHVGAVSVRRLFDDCDVSLHFRSFFVSPACFRILAIISFDKSFPGFPATVIVPACLG